MMAFLLQFNKINKCFFLVTTFINNIENLIRTFNIKLEFFDRNVFRNVTCVHHDSEYFCQKEVMHSDWRI